jgi:hypothetical protein
VRAGVTPKLDDLDIGDLVYAFDEARISEPDSAGTAAPRAASCFIEIVPPVKMRASRFFMNLYRIMRKLYRIMAAA